MKRTRFFWWLVAGPLAVLGAVLALAHPYLAITERSGGHVLVAEGWLEDAQLDSVVAAYRSGGYTQVYTTGSVRPFAYYLHPNEGVEVRFASPQSGSVALNVSGITNAGFLLIAGSDTVLRLQVSPSPAHFQASVPRPIDRLRIVATNTGAADPNGDDIFVQYLRVNGANAHLLQDTTLFVGRDGHTTPAWPTYANSAAAALVRRGLPATQVVAVPSWGRPDSRSWANASYFAVRAHDDHLTAVDVITLGVHARRTRALYRQACGTGMNVGVISIPDPLCGPRDWWRTRVGWYRMLKEVGGSSEAWAVEVTR